MREVLPVQRGARERCMLRAIHCVFCRRWDSVRDISASFQATNKGNIHVSKTMHDDWGVNAEGNFVILSWLMMSTHPENHGGGHATQHAKQDRISLVPTPPGCMLCILYCLVASQRNTKVKRTVSERLGGHGGSDEHCMKTATNLIHIAANLPFEDVSVFNRGS